MGLTQAVEVPPEAAEGGALCAGNAGVIGTTSMGITEVGKFERVQRRAMEMLKG